MQPHHNPSLRCTLIETQTGSLSGFLGATAGRITGKPMLGLGQSGDWVGPLTQELDTEATSTTTTTLTELNTPNNKIMNVGQTACSVFPSYLMGLVEDMMDHDPPAGTSNTAAFDMQSEPSMDLGRELLMLKDAEAQSVAPCFSGMVDRVLSSERPISPSDFLQKYPAPSSQSQLPDSDIPEDLMEEIQQLLAETPMNSSWDSIQDVDVNLFSQLEEPDALNCIMEKCGITNEMEIGIFHHEDNTTKCSSPNPTIMKTEPPSTRSDCVGPVRTRRVRRASRKPVRYRETASLDDPIPLSTGRPTMRAEQEDLMIPTSGTTSARKVHEKLSREEKYLKSRKQNNASSKRCRQKRRENFEMMKLQLPELEKKNRVLQDKVKRLTTLRDNFKDFVNNFLFQRISNKL